MDWDGIGTLALFFSAGTLGVAMIAFRAYKARLSAKIEWARLEREGVSQVETDAHVRHLEEKVERLSERIEFTEKLLLDRRPHVRERALEASDGDGRVGT